MKVLRKITDQILAGSQPDSTDLLTLAQSGVKTIVNLRLDGEHNPGLDPEAERIEVLALGLRYVRIPVFTARLSERELRAFIHTAEQSEGPIFVHCGVGRRACALALAAVAIEAHESGATILARRDDVRDDIVDEKLHAFVSSIPANANIERLFPTDGPRAA